MRPILFVVMTLVAITLTSSQNAAAQKRSDNDSKFKKIFDGKSLKGWHAIPKDCAKDWAVREGRIVGTGSKNRLAYLVWNDTKLKNFELKFSYQLPGKGNTGVEIRSQPDKSGKRPFEGYHADLGHVGIGDHILGAWDFHFAKRKEYPCPRGRKLLIAKDGSTRSSKIADPIELDEIKKMDWNQVRVVAKGRKFEFFINGKTASTFTDNFPDYLDHGAIGLQIHDKGMVVEFKDIYLRKLE